MQAGDLVWACSPATAPPSAPALCAVLPPLSRIPSLRLSHYRPSICPSICAILPTLSRIPSLLWSVLGSCAQRKNGPPVAASDCTGLLCFKLFVASA